MKDPSADNRQNKAMELFERASGLPAQDREGFLIEASNEDSELVQEVLELLQQAEAEGSPFKELVDQMIWPALETLSRNTSQLNLVLRDPEEGSHPREDPMIGRAVSQYEIKSAIGRGGMGMVYRAHDRRLDRTVALKFLPPGLSTDKAAKERFIHEAKAASALDHSNIATVYEIGESEDGQLFIAMGYYPGETLKDKIEKGPIPLKEALDYIIQLASALDKVQQRGVVHRDIKPGNMIITEVNTLKLLDFGLAKLSYASGYTQVGQMMGTVAYMSPEQAKGIDVDQRTDIWSLGVVFYEMLTGKRPFEGEDAQSAIHAILFEDPKPLSEHTEAFPRPIKAIIGNCLMKDPDKRYSSAGDLLEDLKRVQEGLMPAKRGGIAAWGRRSARRKVALWGLPVALLGVFAISLQILAGKDGHPFTRITESPVVEDSGHYMGFSWGDYDGDGDLDLALGNEGEGKPIKLYQNEGDGSFSRVLEGIIATDPIAPIHVSWVDQDNDGDLDLFAVTRMNSAPNAFYRNMGDGSFVKVTDGDWVNTPGTGICCAWADYDNDGFVDLYVTNYLETEPEPNSLYWNMGDGRMESIQNATTAHADTSTVALWSDYDLDGDMDLFVGGRMHPLYRNDGAGKFTHITTGAGRIPWENEGDGIIGGIASANYDNDHNPDIVLATWHVEPSLRLYCNESEDRFLDQTRQLPLAEPIQGVSVAWGDYDNDGFEDLYACNWAGRNVLFHNEGSGRFKQVMDSPLLSTAETSALSTWVDYDNDGDLDLFISNGMWSEFEQHCELYRNEGNKNHWITLTLVGTVSNRSAIGAKVWTKATVNDRTLAQSRELLYQQDPRVHFGLGDAIVVETLRIEWPSGIIQELHDVAVDQFLIIEEESTEN